MSGPCQSCDEPNEIIDYVVGTGGTLLSKCQDCRGRHVAECDICYSRDSTVHLSEEADNLWCCLKCELECNAEMAEAELAEFEARNGAAFEAALAKVEAAKASLREYVEKALSAN